MIVPFYLIVCHRRSLALKMTMMNSAVRTDVFFGFLLEFLTEENLLSPIFVVCDFILDLVKILSATSGRLPLLRLIKTLWLTSFSPLVRNQKAPTRTAAGGPPVICGESISRWRWTQTATVTQIKLQCIFRLKQLKCQSCEAQYFSWGNKRGHSIHYGCIMSWSLKILGVTCENKQTP